MVQRFILTFLTAFPTFLFSQGVEELEKRNGFKDIKLTSKVTEYPGIVFKKNIKDKVYPNAKLYTAKKGNYESIGSLKIYGLEVRTYKGEIFEIKVITEKNPDLYQGLKKAFGEPEFSLASNTYFWRSSSVKLTYIANNKGKIEMVYTSLKMRNRLKSDQKEVVDIISEDF